jgi:hypothetical protein
VTDQGRLSMIDRAHRPSTMRFDEKCELNNHVKKMTTMAASPTLVIAAGPAITTWECLSEDKSFTFYPQGDFHVADIAWNHNGQGKSENAYSKVVGFESVSSLSPH